jgi:hypothetical protein
MAKDTLIIHLIADDGIMENKAFFDEIMSELNSKNLDNSLIYLLRMADLDESELGKYIFEIYSNENSDKIIRINSDIQKVDLGYGDNLKTIFNSILEVNANFTFTNKIVSLSGHGYGFYMFVANLQLKNIVNKSPKDISFDDVNFSYLPTDALQSSILLLEGDNNLKENKKALSLKISSNKNAGQNMSALTMDELSWAIKNSYLKHVDVVVLASCCILNTDSIYSLKEICTYIIGAQTVIGRNCFDYSALVPNGKIDDNYCVAFLAKSFKKNPEIVANYNIGDPPDRRVVPTQFLSYSAIKTGKWLDAFFEELEKLTSQFLKFDIDELQKLVTAINKCKEISYEFEYKAMYKDLKSFLSLLEAYFNNNNRIQKSVSILNDLLKTQILINTQIGNSFSWQGPYYNFPCGFSIHFPSSVNEFNESPMYRNYYSDLAKTNTAFGYETNWKKFLVRLENSF